MAEGLVLRCPRVLPGLRLPAVLIGVVLAIAIAGPSLAPFDPLTPDAGPALLPPAVPLFVLLGGLIEAAGLARAMVAFLAGLLSHVRGGLSYVLPGAMVLVSGISGAKAADMAAVAPVLFPEMRRHGVPEGDLVGLLAASSAMSETIPPSIVLITIAQSPASASLRSSPGVCCPHSCSHSRWPPWPATARPRTRPRARCGPGPGRWRAPSSLPCPHWFCRC